MRRLERVALVQCEVGIQAQPARDHRTVRVGDRFADAGAQHRDELRMRGGGQGRRLALPGAHDGCVGGIADLVLHGFRQPARIVVLEPADAGALVAFGQPTGVASQVDQHHQQGRNVGAVQRALQRGLPGVVAGRKVGSRGLAVHVRVLQ
ncbi:hypothetical protein D3C72_1980370 [compost metagenome]